MAITKDRGAHVPIIDVHVPHSQIPEDGVATEVLTKQSSTPFDMEWDAGAAGPGGVPDGDKGDVIVSGGGLIWLLDPAIVASFAPVSHTHVAADITNFNTAGDARWSLLAHTHVAANVTDFSAAADLRVAAGIATHEAAGDPHPQYMTQAEADALYSVLAHTHTFASLTAKPTTILGYGITDFVSIGDAEWAQLVHTHPWADITGEPTTIGGYGITDFNSLGDARWSLLGHTHSGLAPAGGSATQVLKKIDGADYNYSWQTDATGGAGSAWVATTVTLTTARFEHRQTITDAGVTSTSIIQLKLAPALDSDENDPEMLDLVTLVGIPATGSFDALMSFSDPQQGPIKLQYQVV